MGSMYTYIHKKKSVTVRYYHFFAADFIVIQISYLIFMVVIFEEINPRISKPSKVMNLVVHK